MFNKFAFIGAQIPKTTLYPDSDEQKAIDQRLFDEYVAKNGVEKAQGYLDALNDMDKEIRRIVWRDPVERGLVRTNYVTRQLLEEYIEYKEDILNYGKTKIDLVKNDISKNVSKSDTTLGLT